MKFNPAIAALAATVIAGCKTSPKGAWVASAPGDDGASITRESSARAEGGMSERRDLKAQSEPLTLRAYEVQESAFSDFGMSVKTNLEVKWGGSIEWMLVSGVAPDSSASSMGMVSGDRILAIDGRPLVEIDRDAMLDMLFQRKKGDRSRLLLLGRGQALPRFVTLIASPPSR